MTDMWAEVEALASIVSPLSVDDIAAILDADSDSIVDAVEQLEEEGRVTSDRLGLTSATSRLGPTRMAVLARKLAERLEATGDTADRRGTANFQAGQSSKAFAAFQEALASSQIAPGAEGPLLDQTIQAGRESGSARQTLAPLLIRRARLLRNRGETHRALADLTEATPHLDGDRLVDALAFRGALEDDLQLPADAERSIAMAMLVAGNTQSDAKLGSLLTLQARMLTRLGFEREADACLERGTSLVESHGNEVQQFYTTVNTAWIDLDRGMARDAERGFTLAQQRAGSVEGEASVANQSAYLARALYAQGFAADAYEQVAKARETADTPAVDFIATIAEIEGALALHRGTEAAASVVRLNAIVSESFPAWANRAAALAARTELENDNPTAARGIIERALDDTPTGQNGHRLRVELEAIGLVAADVWDAERAADLSDLMIQSGWHGVAAWLLSHRAIRDKNPHLGIQAAALAHRLGLSPLAIDAAHTAEAWDDPATGVIKLEAQAIARRLPPTWVESWQARPASKAALSNPDGVQVTDDTALAQSLDAALSAAGLSGIDEVLSPAQRRAIGLVPKPRAAAAAARWIGLVVAMFAIAAAAALVFRADAPEPVVLANPTQTTRAVPEVAPEIPLAERRVETGGALSGQSPFAGGETRNAVLEGGFSAPTGVYWPKELVGFVSSDPVLAGGALYVGTERGLMYSVDINRSSSIFEEQSENANSSSATPALVAGFLEGGQSESLVFFADDSGTLVARGIDSIAEVFWSRDLAGKLGGPPLVDESRVVAATDGGFVVSLDAVTGEQLASYPTDEPLEGGFPYPLARHEDVIYATTGDGRILLLRDSDLTLICETDLGSAQVTTHPVIYAGNYFFGSSVSSIIARPAGGCGSPIDVAPAFTIGTEIKFTPVFANQVMYVVSDELILALTVEANEFFFTSIQAGGNITAPPVIVGEQILVSTEFGELRAYDIHTGDPVWTFPVGSIVQTRPAAGDGVILVATARGDLIAIAGE